jgi:hypothetical protein
VERHEEVREGRVIVGVIDDKRKKSTIVPHAIMLCIHSLWGRWYKSQHTCMDSKKQGRENKQRLFSIHCVASTLLVV